MTGTKFYVIHPDGSSSTRGSKTHVYTHAVEVLIDPAREAAIWESRAQYFDEQVAQYDRILANSIVHAVEGTASGSSFGPRTKYYLIDPADGREIWVATRWKDDDPYLDVDDLRDRIEAYRDNSLKSAADNRKLRDKAARLGVTYGVFRWSHNEENAMRALREAEKIHPAANLRVVPTTTKK